MSWVLNIQVEVDEPPEKDMASATDDAYQRLTAHEEYGLDGKLLGADYRWWCQCGDIVPWAQLVNGVCVNCDAGAP